MDVLNRCVQFAFALGLVLVSFFSVSAVESWSLQHRSLQPYEGHKDKPLIALDWVVEAQQRPVFGPAMPQSFARLNLPKHNAVWIGFERPKRPIFGFEHKNFFARFKASLNQISMELIPTQSQRPIVMKFNVGEESSFNFHMKF